VRLPAAGRLQLLASNCIFSTIRQLTDRYAVAFFILQLYDQLNKKKEGRHTAGRPS